MSKGTVQIAIEFDDTGARKSISILDQGLNKMGSSAASSVGQLAKGVAVGNLMAEAVGRIGSAFEQMAMSAGRALVDAVQASAAYGNELEKASQKFGVAADALAELRYAADLGDVSFETLGTGLKKLAQATIDASKGEKTASEAFDDLGISIRNAGGELKTQQQLIIEIADKFSVMEDGAKKTAISVDLLGRSGAELIPAFNGGGAAIEEATRKARYFGLVLSKEAIKASAEFGDNLTDLQRIGLGLQNDIGQAIIPTLNRLMNSFIDNDKAVIGFRQKIRDLESTLVAMGMVVAEDIVHFYRFAEAQANAAAAFAASWKFVPGMGGLADAALGLAARQAQAAAENAGYAEKAFASFASIMAELSKPITVAAEAQQQLNTQLRTGVEILKEAGISGASGAVIPPGGTLSPNVPLPWMPKPGPAFEPGAPYSPNSPIPPGGTIGLPSNVPPGYESPSLQPPEPGAWTDFSNTVGAALGNLTDQFGLYQQTIQAGADAWGDFITGQVSGGEALRRVSVGILSSLSKQFMAWSLQHLAMGIAAMTNPVSLAMFGPPPTNFKASAIFGAAAALTGGASRAMSGGSGGGGGLGPKGSTFNPISTTESSFTLDVSARSRQNAEISRLNATIASLEKRIGSMSPGDVVTVAAGSKGLMQYAQPRTDYKTINARVYDEPLVG